MCKKASTLQLFQTLINRTTLYTSMTKTRTDDNKSTNSKIKVILFSYGHKMPNSIPVIKLLSNPPAILSSLT